MRKSVYLPYSQTKRYKLDGPTKYKECIQWAMRKSTLAYINVILSSVFGKLPEKKGLKFFMGFNVRNVIKFGVIFLSLLIFRRVCKISESDY
jgi:hypothetical protein